MNDRQRIEEKIIKLHKKYIKMQKNPSKISMYAFIPMALITSFGLALSSNLVFSNVIATLVGASAGLGLTAATIYNFSKDFYNTRLNRIESKLVDLENQLCEQYNFSKDGNILSVPPTKVEEYLKGEYKLISTYIVEFENNTASLTTEEIERFRQIGYEFYKNADKLKAVSSNDVKALKLKGCTIKRDGIETIFFKGNNKLNLDTCKAEYLFPEYNKHFTEYDKANKERLITTMLLKSAVCDESSKKSDVLTNEIENILNQ